MVFCTKWTASWTHPDGNRNFLYLNSNKVKRYLNLNWFNQGNQWNANTWFVVVPQV